MENSLQTVVAKLESLFSIFNEEYYEGKLETPILAVSPDGGKGAYGWMTCYRAWRNDDVDSEGFYEINLCAEHLSRPVKELCATLLHEMAHLYCLQEGIKDTSRNNSYHNKKFKLVAEEHGLIIQKDEKYGWTITDLNEEAEQFIDSMDTSGFGLYRVREVQVEKGSSSKKSSSRKYVCPMCDTPVRATKEVRIICADCDVEMELQE